MFFAGRAWANINVPQILHLNYHAALHSRWTPDEVQLTKDLGLKVVVTYHDTIGERSPAYLRAHGDNRLDRLEALASVADALIVHEPCDGFPHAYYWRMGVPGPESPLQFGKRRLPDTHVWKTTYGDSGYCFRHWETQPVLGSIGFPFPWKNFDRLATITRELGWALVLIAPGATEGEVAGWRTANPDSYIRTDFVDRQQAVSLLSACDATAFPYTCANTAQSAAILQGIAARKPVIATAGCRQFRALFGDPLGRTAITWIESLDDLAFTLSHFIRLERCSPAIVALAEQDSWIKLGVRYAQLYRSLV
jgi:glycosyltransferase involved in cell wall biosynthesis